MLCRNCHEETGDEVLVDLGMQPLANSLLTSEQAHMTGARLAEKTYPLAPVICQNWHCRLIQLPELPSGVGFGKDYPYRSGQSETWKRHLADLIRHVAPQLAAASPQPAVVEVGGNDGTLGSLLPAVCSYRNIDPTASVKKSDTVPRFLTRELGKMIGPHADWVVANNVMAHVPDLDDFIAGIWNILSPTGLLTVEVPDLNILIEQGHWDTVYHEHYSYFNRQTAIDALERRGFFVSHTENIPTHGGSIRLYARKNMLTDHSLHGIPLRIMKPYPVPNPQHLPHAEAEWWEMFCERNRGKRIVGYGAPAKASTWLNYCDVTQIEYIVDSTPEKIGKYTPGSHIPIISPEQLAILDVLGFPPEIVVILAWNWADEILPKIPEGPEVWARGRRIR